jgi:dienelactone hydrolase
MKHRDVVSGILLIISFAVAARAAENRACPWNVQALSVTPKVFEDPQRSTDDVKAIFYEGLPWKGKPTRVFAYYGLPKTKGKQKVPAMVLVHGGGGSAYIPWVRLWVSRGYAAIAMDTCGCISSGGYKDHPRHEFGGPPGWGGFDQIDQPIEDQWTYHAVADVVLAHSLIRSFPQVDPARIGVTGVSWGGYLVCIVAGVDRRFKFAAPVYGCGFLGDDSVWLVDFQKMGEDKARRWLGLWDPAVYLPRARLPMLWVDGSNDFAYPLDSLQKSYRLPEGPRTLCVRVRMAHGHGGPGENPQEIQAMAESLFRNGVPLVRIDRSGRQGLDVWAVFATGVPITKTELNYTTDTGQWQNRKWETIPAELDVKAGKVSARLPKEATVYYFNLVDNRDLVVSSEHEELQLNKVNGAK